MRRRLLVLTVAAGVLIAGGVAGAEVGTYEGLPVVPVYVNRRLVQGDVPAVILSGRTMVPLRVVSEALGAQAIWDESSRSVLVVDEEKCALATWGVESAKMLEDQALSLLVLGATVEPLIRAKGPAEYARFQRNIEAMERTMQTIREVRPKFSDLVARYCG